MDPEFEVAIVGGAFSGAAAALLIKRRRPETRILIIEKATEFDRKVGESTTEVSSCFLTRILGLTNYLGHEQLTKQGLRLWFANRPDQAFDDCVEIGARYQTRLASSLRRRQEVMQGTVLVDVPFPDEPPLETIYDNLLIGDVDTVAEKLVAEVHATRPVHVCFSFKVGNTPHKAAMRSMELMIGEVKPKVEKALGAPTQISA